MSIWCRGHSPGAARLRQVSHFTSERWTAAAAPGWALRCRRAQKAAPERAPVPARSGAGGRGRGRGGGCGIAPGVYSRSGRLGKPQPVAGTLIFAYHISMLIELAGNVEGQLRDLASRQGRAVDALVEEALREYLLVAAITDVEASEVAKTQEALASELHDILERSEQEPVALWNGEIPGASSDHDTIYDKP